MRPRTVLIILGAALIVAFLVLSLADQLLVNLYWFTALHYRGVFSTTLIAQVAIFVGVWIVAFLAIAVSGWIALRLSRERERLRVVRRTEEMVEINLPELIRALGDRVPWHLVVMARHSMPCRSGSKSRPLTVTSAFTFLRCRSWKIGEICSC